MSENVLTTKQKMLIAALLGNRSIEQACAKVGIATKTFNRWQEQPEFLAELRRCEDEIINQVVRTLTTTATHALTVVTMIMADKENNPSVRLRAATVILEQFVKLREHADLSARITALEGLNVTK